LVALLSRHDPEAIEKYLGVRALKDDPFRDLVNSRSAHASEHAILRMFWWLWIALASIALSVHLGWHVVSGFGVLK
jgi:hypothetical protein